MTRKYVIGMNVDKAAELEGTGAQIKAFLDEIGDGDLELHVNINPLLASESTTAAIGFAVEEEEEYDEMEDDEE